MKLRYVFLCIILFPCLILTFDKKLSSRIEKGDNEKCWELPSGNLTIAQHILKAKEESDSYNGALTFFRWPEPESLKTSKEKILDVKQVSNVQELTKTDIQKIITAYYCVQQPDLNQLRIYLTPQPANVVTWINKELTLHFNKDNHEN